MRSKLTQRKINDRWILATKPHSNNPKDHYLEEVLCYLPHNELTPFVTWTYNNNDEGFFGGNYMERLNDAIENFMIRGELKYDKEFISEYDGIECHYVQYVDNENVEQCESEDAHFISVYLHKTMGGIDWITDHLNGADAMRIIRFISNKYKLPVMFQPDDLFYVKLKPIIT